MVALGQAAHQDGLHDALGHQRIARGRHEVHRALLACPCGLHARTAHGGVLDGQRHGHVVARALNLQLGLLADLHAHRIGGRQLGQEMGIEMVHIPYKGQGPALADLLGGQVDVMFGNWPEFRGHVQSGKLVALGMATRQRSQFAPQVPTLSEQGVALESNSWQGLLARRPQAEARAPPMPRMPPWPSACG